MRNTLTHVTRGDRSVVAAALRTIFAQPTQAAAGQQLELVREKMTRWIQRPRWPKAAAALQQAEEDVLAHMAFPAEHWTRLYSTNLLERLNKEIKRCNDVVCIFPDVAAVERLVRAILMDIDDGWQADRRYSSQASMQQLYSPMRPAAAARPMTRW